MYTRRNPRHAEISDLTICCLKMDRAWPISKGYLRCTEGRVFSLYIQTFCEEVIESQNISPNTDPQQVWLEDGDWMSRVSWWNWFDSDSKPDNFYAIFIPRRLPTPTANIFLTSTTLVLYLWFNWCLQNCFRPKKRPSPHVTTISTMKNPSDPGLSGGHSNTKVPVISHP